MTRAVAYRRSRSTRSAQYWHQSLRRGSRSLVRSTHAVLLEFRLWLLLFAGALVALAIAILLFSPIFNVRQIDIRTQDGRLDREEIQHTLVPLFHSRLLFVTVSQVQSLLVAQYPDITQVTIQKKYPSSLTVSVNVDPLVGNIIIDAPQQGSGSIAQTGSGVHAYITAKGYIIMSRLQLAHTPLQPITITDWGVAPENRTIILQPDALHTIFLARDTLRDSFGLPVNRIVVYLRAKEFHVQAGHVSLWFDLESPLAIQFGRFREFLKSASLNQAKEYVDLRISDRVVYK